MEKVMITLPHELLGTIDSFSKSLKLNRSQFIRQSLLEMIEQKKKEEFEHLLCQGYQEMSSEDLTDVEAYLESLTELKGEDNVST